MQTLQTHPVSKLLFIVTKYSESQNLRLFQSTKSIQPQLTSKFTKGSHQNLEREKSLEICHNDQPHSPLYFFLKFSSTPRIILAILIKCVFLDFIEANLRTLPCSSEVKTGSELVHRQRGEIEIPANLRKYNNTGGN